MTLARMARFGLVTTSVVVCSCAMSPLGGQMTSLAANLSAFEQVPPNGTAGTGALRARLDRKSNVLTWRLTYGSLTGPVVSAHFHGPAATGQVAAVVLPIPSPTHPSEGKATLTAAQVTDLLAGRWYIILRTRAFPAGEIRGQVMAGQGG